MDENQELGWLVRDTSNRIRGPFKQGEIVAMIKKGQLKGKAEISRANSYWFSIEEKTELGRFMPEFNGGRPPPEAPTQMTATLTEADIQDHGVEITTFTAAPKLGKEGEKPAEAGQGGQIEWLSDEFAEEFGADFGTTVSVQTDLTASSPLEAEPASTPTEQPTPKDQTLADKAKKEEMLRRATVKADTLPSEHKSFQGDRPKPIDTLIRSPGKPGASAIPSSQHTTVSVPVEDGPAPKMIHEEDDSKAKAGARRRYGIAAAALLCAGALGAGIYFFALKGGLSSGAKEPARKVQRRADPIGDVRRAILVFDLETAKSALSDMDLDPAAHSEPSTYLAQALVKKEFLYDVEGATLALQTARQQARSKRSEAEVDNLMAVYGFDRDPAASTELLRRNLEGYKDDPVFRYNYALGLLRTGKRVEAIGQLEQLLTAAGTDVPLVEDVALAIGWALEAQCGGGARDPICRKSADDAYLRALDANPNSAKARLGLALFRLRRGGIKNSEADFRAFLDLAPDLDPPNRVINFRKLSNNEFYAFAHAQIVELNTPSQNMNKPSPLIMAADGIVSCIQGRTAEAGKILEGALTSAPGDLNVLKAIGYLRWKDGQLNELVDALKDLRDRSSFALNLMLGKAYLKLRKREQAERHFRSLVEYPGHSEGHSLLGELLMEQPEKADEAKAEFQAALKIDPLDILALRGLQRLGVSPPLAADIQKNLPF